MHIMDKLIEHPEFTSGVSQIHHVAFVVKEEYARVGLKLEIDSRTYDPKASDSRSSHSVGFNDALISFATLDYAAFLGFGQLHMVGIRQIYMFDNVDEPMGAVTELEVLIGGGGELNMYKN